jgi:hypothetical protein
MPGPSIPWKTLETEAWRTQIDSVPPARYKLASPRTITGSPSFAMESADQHCVVRVYIGAGEAPDLSLTVSGTTPVPMTNAVGGNLTAQELADLRIEVGMPQPGFALLTTDEPNGSPSAPFASVDERTAWAAANLASLLPGRTTVWGPGNVEYVWNGPLATDWQGIRGPYLGSAENPFATVEERDAVMPAASRPERTRCWILNPLCPDGMTEFIVRGGAWKPRAGQIIYAAYGALLDTTAAAMSIGAWNLNVWTSPVLPSWIVDCAVLSLFAMHDARDPSSTAMEGSRIGIWKSDSDRGPAASDSFFGHSQTGAFSSGRSYGTVRIAGRISGTEIRGNDGTAIGTVLAAFPNRIIGSINGTSARICHDFYPGATTNLDKLFAVELRVEG